PAVAEIHRFGHDSSLLHGRRNADREDVVSPVACQRGDALDELLRGQGRPRVEAPPLAAARAQHLDAGPADVDGKDGRRDGAYTGSRTIIAIAAWWAPVSARATSPEDSRRWSTLESYSSVATASGAATSATRRAYSFARAGRCQTGAATSSASRAPSVEWRPPPRIRSPCRPCSTMRPWSSTTIWSASRTVESRWATAIVVRPSERRSSASCTSRSVSVSSELVASSRTR